MTPPTQSGEPTGQHGDAETQLGPAQQQRAEQLVAAPPARPPQPPTAGGPAGLEGLPAGPYKWRGLTESQRAWAKEYDLTPLQAQEMAMWL